MLIVVAGFPGAFIGMLFTGSVLIEVIFSLDGLGLLGFESVVNRDYPVVFGTLFIFTLLGLILNIVSDVVYTLIDPRSEEHTSELQSLMRISYAVFCLKKKNTHITHDTLK